MTDTETLWVASSGTDDAVWHIAVARESVGPSGKVYGRFFVGQCGVRFGGPYGTSTRRGALLASERVCKRCQRSK